MLIHVQNIMDIDIFVWAKKSIETGAEMQVFILFFIVHFWGHQVLEGTGFDFGFLPSLGDQNRQNQVLKWGGGMIQGTIAPTLG